MKSKLPKVLHRLGGRALLGHVVDTARALEARRVVVITGHGAIEVEAACAGFICSAADIPSKARSEMAMKFVRQEPQLGTGHAVLQAVPELPDDGVVVILSGDVPLTQASTLRDLVSACAGTRLALLTIELTNPTGYGRIVRAQNNGTPSHTDTGTDTGSAAIPGDKGAVLAIAEQKDATPEQLLIREIYSGIMAVPAALLKRWLARLDNRNAQGEFYLTDIVKFAVTDQIAVVAHVITDEAQVAGINSPLQLAALERVFQQRLAIKFMEAGVRLADPARFDVRGSLQCGQEVEIDVNCIFEGTVVLGDDVKIGANSVIKNAQIDRGAVIHPFTHIEGGVAGSKDAVNVGAGALIGPFARLRPGAQLAQDVHIGNFVEVKNSSLAKGAKANHLAYLGDATVGERVNYGAGSITANYDGAFKHRTLIEADVHIGSNCVLVAPVTIGAGGTVGGGSTITKDTAAGVLTVGRGKQTSIPGWKRPRK